LADQPRPGEHRVAAVSAEADLLVAYTPRGHPLKVDLGRMSPPNVAALWLNPRDGRRVPIGIYPAKGTMQFTPPVAGRGCDLLLVVHGA